MELTPQEIEVWYVLPAIRRELCRALIIKYKKSQKECAGLLGLTEAAVSQYKKEKRAKGVVFDSKIIGEIGKSAEKLSKNKKSLLSELHRLSSLINIKKVVCGIHKEQCEVPQKCKICLG